MTAPCGVWIIASIVRHELAPIVEPYPCLCGWHNGRHTFTRCGRGCPCRGRRDGAPLPAYCCGRRA